MKLRQSLASLCAFVVASYSWPVLANEGGAMPQFDARWFESQLLWLALSFFTLYVLMRYVALPRVTRTQGNRQQNLATDMTAAQAARDNAERSQSANTKAMDDARATAGALLATAMADAAQHAAAQTTALDADVSKMLTTAMTRINQARTTAMATLEDSAATVAQQATSRLLGAVVDKNAALAAVKRALQQKG